MDINCTQRMCWYMSHRGSKHLSVSMGVVGGGAGPEGGQCKGRTRGINVTSGACKWLCCCCCLCHKRKWKSHTLTRDIYDLFSHTPAHTHTHFYVRKITTEILMQHATNPQCCISDACVYVFICGYIHTYMYIIKNGNHCKLVANGIRTMCNHIHNHPHTHTLEHMHDRGCIQRKYILENSLNGSISMDTRMLSSSV